MMAYSDTSFLCALYVKQTNSPVAARIAGKMCEPLQLAPPLLYEFRQSLRFQVWRNKSNPREGLTMANASAALLQLEADLRNGFAVIALCEFVELFRLAEALSERHTVRSGYRSFDLLHVATALYFKASEFLTFDTNQHKLARAEGLKVKP